MGTPEQWYHMISTFTNWGSFQSPQLVLVHPNFSPYHADFFQGGLHFGTTRAFLWPSREFGKQKRYHLGCRHHIVEFEKKNKIGGCSSWRDTAI